VSLIPSRCFYSRKSFFFPERQQGPHRDWTDEVRFLDNVFGGYLRLCGELHNQDQELT
jgi:hypothetical protein